MIGHPTTQVKSPTTFNRYFREKHIDGVMVAIDVHPAAVAHFFSLLRGWQSCPGCIVTIPHKQEAARHADELSPRHGTSARSMCSGERKADGSSVIWSTASALSRRLRPTASIQGES